MTCVRLRQVAAAVVFSVLIVNSAAAQEGPAKKEAGVADVFSADAGLSIMNKYIWRGLLHRDIRDGSDHPDNFVFGVTGSIGF